MCLYKCRNTNTTAQNRKWGAQKRSVQWGSGGNANSKYNNILLLPWHKHNTTNRAQKHNKMSGWKKAKTNRHRHPSQADPGRTTRSSWQSFAGQSPEHPCLLMRAGIKIHGSTYTRTRISLTRIRKPAELQIQIQIELQLQLQILLMEGPPNVLMKTAQKWNI